MPRLDGVRFCHELMTRRPESVCTSRQCGSIGGEGMTFVDQTQSTSVQTRLVFSSSCSAAVHHHAQELSVA
jgi:hypothetical protein